VGFNKDKKARTATRDARFKRAVKVLKERVMAGEFQAVFQAPYLCEGNAPVVPEDEIYLFVQWATGAGSIEFVPNGVKASGRHKKYTVVLTPYERLPASVRHLLESQDGIRQILEPLQDEASPFDEENLFTAVTLAARCSRGISGDEEKDEIVRRLREVVRYEGDGMYSLTDKAHDILGAEPPPPPDEHTEDDGAEDGALRDAPAPATGRGPYKKGSIIRGMVDEMALRWKRLFLQVGWDEFQTDTSARWEPLGFPSPGAYSQAPPQAEKVGLLNRGSDRGWWKFSPETIPADWVAEWEAAHAPPPPLPPEPDEPECGAGDEPPMFGGLGTGEEPEDGAGAILPDLVEYSPAADGSGAVMEEPAVLPQVEEMDEAALNALAASLSEQLTELDRKRAELDQERAEITPRLIQAQARLRHIRITRAREALATLDEESRRALLAELASAGTNEENK